MKIATVAPIEVANHYLNDIRAMIEKHESGRSGTYQNRWAALREIERSALCQAAGLTQEHINMSLTDMSNWDKKKLLAAIKNMKRVVSLFNYANVERMQGFN